MNIRKQLEAHAERNRQEMESGRARTPWSGGSLADAKLAGANLECAYLMGAKLMGANLSRADLTRADLTRADLTCAKLTLANLTRANLYRANLTYANLECADIMGASLAYADLTGADLTDAYLTDANITRAMGLRRPGMPDPSKLRRRVADHIEAHPELHDQGKWGDGSAEPACQTPCCVAGWACHLGGGSYGLEVPTAAKILLHVDGQPMPSFDSDTKREEILAALRGES